MSSGLILKMNKGYNGVSKELEKVRVVKGEMISYSCLKGTTPFIDYRSGRITMS
jgi:hypothetical protein